MSIQAHSKQSNEVIIFSVYQKDAGDTTNLMNHKHILHKLNNKEGINARELDGYYKGCPEKSIMVEIKPNYSDIELYIPLLCKQYNQESYLHLGKIQAHGIRKAQLVYADNTIEDIGYFRSRPAHLATTRESYTYDVSRGIHYVVEKDYTQAGRVI